MQNSLTTNSMYVATNRNVTLQNIEWLNIFICYVEVVFKTQMQRTETGG